MRYLIIFLSLTLIYACSKDDDEATPTYEFEGDWQWEITQGGIAGAVITPESIGKSRSLTITSDSIIFREEGVIYERSAFIVETGKSIYSFDNIPLIKVENSFTYSYEYNPSRLILREEAYDGFSSTYIR